MEKNKYSGKHIDTGENIDSAKYYSDSGKKIELKKIMDSENQQSEKNRKKIVIVEINRASEK